MRSTSTEVTVRFSDCDPMGHTNNANYFSYMEQGRVALFREMLQIPARSLKPGDFPFIIAEISCRFLKPTYMEDILQVHLKVGEIKNSSFIIEYELKDAASGALVATGKSAQVWFDYEAGKSMPIPDSFRNWLSS